MMIARAVWTRRAASAAFCQCPASRVSGRRGLAAAASGTFTYESSSVNGIKYASRDLPGPTTTLAIVSKLGTRFIPPAWIETLEQFAFKSTERRSALRITRETELLGAQLMSFHTRENMIVGAKFLREDLPYFLELLAEVISETRYTHSELAEEVLPTLTNASKALSADPAALASDAVHSVAFHRGLGRPLESRLIGSALQHVDPIRGLAAVAYAKSNIALVANGADHPNFSKWTNQFFANVSLPENDSASPVRLDGPQSKYHGGETRVTLASGNAMTLAFPGSSSFTGGFWKPEVAVLASLLGGRSQIKWSPGFSLLSKAAHNFPRAHVHTDNLVYSDAGLLAVNITGSAIDVAKAAKEAVDVLKQVSSGKLNSEDFKKAVAAAKFQVLESGQNITTGLETTGAGLIYGGKPHQLDEVAKSIESVSEAKLKEVAKTLLENKASVAAVGRLETLPFAEEIGLKV